MFGSQLVIFKEFDELLENRESVEQTELMFQNHYPALYLRYLEDNNMSDKIKELEDYYFKFRSLAPNQFSLYVHGYLLPHLE